MITFTLLTTLICSVGALLYFKIADRYNIIDKPNQRSSHTEITIRGGGMVFLLSSLVYAVYSHLANPYFLAGLFVIGTVSFIDDVKTLSSAVRLPLHILAVVLLSYQVLGAQEQVWVWVVLIILATGVINAYNFMDGVNGITAGYSLVVLVSLFYINQHLHFADETLILASIAANVVFGFFNFRKKAACFAGDVGSVSIAFIVVFLVASLIYQTGNFIYILLLAVYGVDSVLTIIHRLSKKENIFEAHRSHLYQWLVNPGPFTHLQMSGVYMLIQLGISIGVLWVYPMSIYNQLLFALLILGALAVAYILIKRRYIKRYELV